VFVF